MSYAFLSSKILRRLDDGACIPLDPLNRDYQRYLDWLAAGNLPPLVPQDTSAEDNVERLKKSAEKDTVKGLAILDALSRKTPAEVQQYVQSNIRNQADIVNLLAAISAAVSLLLNDD